MHPFSWGKWKKILADCQVNTQRLTANCAVFQRWPVVGKLLHPNKSLKYRYRVLNCQNVDRSSRGECMFRNISHVVLSRGTTMRLAWFIAIAENKDLSFS